MHCLLSVNQDKEAAPISHVLMCRNSWKILEKKSDKRKPALPDFIMLSKLNKLNNHGVSGYKTLIINVLHYPHEWRRKFRNRHQ